MPKIAGCAELQVLERFALGQLTEAEAEPLAEHVLDCPACLARLETLTGADTLTVALAGATVPNSPSEPVQRLIEQLVSQRPSRPGDPTVDQSSPREASIADVPASDSKLDFLAPAQAANELGRLGAYRVLKVLGQGGMGMVFLAEDTRLDRLVALKVMLPKFAENAAAKQRFLREAKSAAALKHDHVITIYQVDEDRGVPFLAMEYLEGQSLDQRLKAGAPPAMAEIVRIGREIAQGLAAAHAKGLIHRDVKPGNIWLEARDAGARVKILDFGLARAQVDDVHVTQSGAIVGTPAYMAPEQARGDKSVDHRVDLFSLGCVLYRLCTGTLPFQGENTMAILMALGLHEPPPPHTVNPQTPPELSELIMRLLEKDAAKRTSSARDAVAALAEIERRLAPPVIDSPRPAAAATAMVATPPTVIRPVAPAPIPPRPGAFSPRRRLVMAAAVLLLLLGPLVYFFAGTVVRFVSNRGELIIEIDDPKIEVTIKGDDVIVHDRDKERRFVLTPGKDYEIQVREPGEDGIRFATRSFSIVRGGRERLTARMLLADAKMGAIDPDRRAAYWVVRHGGKVKVRVDNQAEDQLIASAVAVPRERFTVKEVDLSHCRTVPEEEQNRLEGLKGLEVLILVDTGLPGTSFGYLGTLPNLRRLVLRGDSHPFQYLNHLRVVALPRTAKLTQIYGPDQAPAGTDADRKAAEWALALGASVVVETDEDLLSIQGAALPSERFRLRMLRLGEGFRGRTYTEVDDKSLAILKDLHHLRFLELSRTRITDEGVRLLSGYAGLAKLEVLRVRDVPGITDACLPALEKFRQLSHFAFKGTQISDAGMKIIGRMPKLTLLEINSRVGNAGLAELVKLPLESLSLFGTQNVTGEGYRLLARFPQLTRLDLRHMPSLRDEDIAVVKELPRLQLMHLDSTPIGNAALVHLRNLGLVFLAVGETRIDDAGLPELSKMSSLEELHLAKTAVSDAGLDHLKKLKRLRLLNLKKTCVSARGVAGLHAALPQCKIESDHGTFEPGSAPASQLPPYVSPSKHALVFDGKSNYVSFPTIKYEDNQPLTIEMDIQPAKEQVTDVMTSGAVGFVWDAKRGPPMFSFGIMTQDKDFIGVNAMTGTVPREVVHLAGVLEPDEIRIYLNGKLQEAKTLGGKKVARPKLPLSLGANDWLARNKPGSSGDAHSSLNFFAGHVQRIRISRVARYKQDFTPGSRFVPDKDTIAVYHFDEGQGDKLIESSGNGHHGKIVGAKWVKVEDQPSVNRPLPPYTSPSKHALAFDGESSHVSMPTLKYDGTHPLTIEMDIAPSTLQACNLLGNGRQGFVWEAKSRPTPYAQFAFGIGAGEDWVGARAQVAKVPSEILHVAGVFDGSEVRIFLNGKLAQRTPFDSRKVQVSPDSFMIGASPWLVRARPPRDKNLSHLNYFEGLVQRVRISKVARYLEDFKPGARFEPDKDTLALYHCDEGQGDKLIDSSGNGHHGKIVGAKWVKVEDVNPPIPGVVQNSALHFANEASGAEADLTFDSTRAITLETWLRATGPGQAPIVRMDGPELSIALTRHSQDQIGFVVQGKQAIKVAEAIRQGEWMHVTGVWDGKAVKLFINGKSVGIAIPHQKSVPFYSKMYMRIAHDSGPKTTLLNAVIKEVRISSVARYVNDFVPRRRFEPDKDTIALYHFDEGQGDKLIDSSGNGHHGKIVGAKWVKVSQAAFQQASHYLAFRGNDRVDVPSLTYDGRTPLTLEAWLRNHAADQKASSFMIPAALGPFAVKINQPENNYSWVALGPVYKPGKPVSLDQEQWVLWGTPSKSYPRGEWLHVAGQWDGARGSFFVNGQLASKHITSMRSLSSGKPVVSPTNEVYARFDPDPEQVRKAVLPWIEASKDQALGLGATAPPPIPFRGDIRAVRVSKVIRYSNSFTPPQDFAGDFDTVAVYRFREGQGDKLIDSSGNGHHGKIIGAKWLKVDASPISTKPLQPNANGGLLFDTNGSNVEVSNFPYDKHSALTIEARVGLSASRGDGPFVILRGGGSDYVLVRDRNGLLVFIVNDANGTTYFSRVFDGRSRRFVTLTAVIKGKERVFFVDGKRITMTSADSSIKILPDGNPRLRMGSDFNLPYTLNAILDEVRISKVARYDKDFAPPMRFEPDKDTIALYQFDEGQGDKLVDSSGNGHHGKIVGARWVKVDLPKAEASVDLERRLAQRILARGGTVSVRTLGEAATWIDAEAQLPPGPFEVVGIKVAPAMTADDLHPAPNVEILYLKGIANADELLAAAAHLPRLREVWGHQAAVSDAGLKHLAGLSDITALELFKTNIQGPGLVHLAGHKKLNRLVLGWTPLDDSAVPYLKPHRQLRQLRLEGTQVSVQNVVALATALPKCTIWSNFGTFAPGTSAPPRAAFEQLYRLGGWVQIEVGGGKHSLTTLPAALAQAQRVHAVNFEPSQSLRDPDLAVLRDFAEIQALSLYDTSIGDAGLEHLKNLKNLRVINLKKTRVTPKGIATLRMTLPKSKIESDHGTFGAAEAAGAAVSLQFDGKTSYAEIPSLRFDTEQAVTLEGLVTVDQEQDAMLLCRVAGKSWMSLSASGKQWGLVGVHNNQQQGVAAPNSLVKGVKAHVAGTWDGKQLRLFINGKESIGRVTLPNKPITIKSGQTGTTQIGGAPGSTVFLAGKIHGLRVAKVARYDKDFTPPARFELDENTIALYRFDEGQGDKLTDSSGNDHHGRIVGAKWVKAAHVGATSK